MLGLQALQRLGHHRRELAVGEHGVGFAVVHLPGQQRSVQPSVERVEHGVERGHRVVHLYHFGRVGQHHRDGAAAPHAQRAQRRRQARAALAGLCPGVAPRAVDHRGQVAEHLGTALDEAHRRERDEIGGVLVEMPVVDAAGHVFAPMCVARTGVVATHAARPRNCRMRWLMRAGFSTSMKCPTPSTSSTSEPGPNQAGTPSAEHASSAMQPSFMPCR